MNEAVSEIIACESEAETYEAKADELKWRAAELIHSQLEAGMSQRELAREIGKDHKHVCWMAKAWRDAGDLGPHGRPPFNKAYQAAKRKPKPERSGDKSDRGTAPLPKPDEVAEHDLGDRFDVEPTRIVDKYVRRTEDVSQSVRIPGLAGDSLRRLADSITDLVYGDDPRRSVLHVMDAYAELVSALSDNR